MDSDTFARVQQKPGDRPARPREQNGLDRPTEHLAERGGYEGHVMESSLYTKASLHPVLAGAALVGAGLFIAALVGAPRNNGTSRRRA